MTDLESSGTKAEASPAWSLPVMLLAVLALALAFNFLPLKEWMLSLREQIRALGWLAPVAYIALYCLFTVLIIPPTALSLISGSLFGLGWALFLTLLAANLAAPLAFLFARTVFRARTETWARKHPKFEAIDRAVSENGFKIVLLLRISPLFPYTWVNYLLGITRVPLWKFVAGTILGMPPITAAMVYIGSLPAEMSAQKDMGRLILQLAGLLATIIAAVVITRYARKALHEMVADSNSTR